MVGDASARPQPVGATQPSPTNCNTARSALLHAECPSAKKLHRWNYCGGMAERSARSRYILLHDELIERAREAAGADDLSTSDVVRLGLATLAGVDVAEYTPRPGRPRKQPQSETLPLETSELIAS